MAVIGVRMVAKDEVCAAAEDQRMRMRCGFERKEVKNGSIVDIRNIQYDYEMCRSCLYFSNKLTLSCSVNGLLVGNIKLRSRNDLALR